MSTYDILTTVFPVFAIIMTTAASLVTVPVALKFLG